VVLAAVVVTAGHAARGHFRQPGRDVLPHRRLGAGDTPPRPPTITTPRRVLLVRPPSVLGRMARRRTQPHPRDDRGDKSRRVWQPPWRPSPRPSTQGLEGRDRCGGGSSHGDTVSTVLPSPRLRPGPQPGETGVRAARCGADRGGAQTATAATNAASTERARRRRIPASPSPVRAGRRALADRALPLPLDHRALAWTSQCATKARVSSRWKFCPWKGRFITVATRTGGAGNCPARSSGGNRPPRAVQRNHRPQRE
jgi:hypothetical protein